MANLLSTRFMTALVVGLTVLLARPMRAQSHVNSPEADRPLYAASTVRASKKAIVGDCGVSRTGSGDGDVDYVMVYKSNQSIVCVDRSYWEIPANASAIPGFFPYFDAVIAHDKLLFPVVPPETQFIFKITTPTGGASTGCGFSKWGPQRTFCNTVTGDAFTNAAKDPITGEQVQGFWGYLFPLHESINVFTGLLSGGWPMDWWADHRSPFPNAMDAVFMQSIADDSTTLDEATKRSLRASARLQLERFTDPANRAGKYDPEVVMFLDLFKKYGGFKAYADSFRYAIVQDGLRWTSVSKHRNFTGDDNYSENLSEYVIAYLQLGFGVSCNLASAFRDYRVGTLDKRVRPYDIDANKVEAIANAHCSIRSAANAGFKVSHELSELRKGNFKNAQASGGTSASCPSECVFSENRCGARFWTRKEVIDSGITTSARSQQSRDVHRDNKRDERRISMVAMPQNSMTEQDANKAIVQASFDGWRSGTGGPFELLAPEAEWTIVGSSPLSKTYHSRQEFLDSVITPFNARMMKPLVPSVRRIFADADMVIILFDAAATAKDGLPYRNTYTWYFQMKEGKVIKAIAFFDTRDFDEFWTRVSPAS